MKKLILSLFTLTLSLTALGQQAGDNFVIKTSEAGKTTEWSLAGDSKNGDISTIKHKSNQLILYAKGYEGIEWATYDIDKIESITFNVFHKGSYVEESAAQAVKTWASVPISATALMWLPYG